MLTRLTDPALLAEVEEKGAYLRARLEALPHVTQVRGLGMMLGAVLDGAEAKDVAARCVQAGLLILTAKTLLRLLPPLNITKEEMDQGLERLEAVLSAL